MPFQQIELCRIATSLGNKKRENSVSIGNELDDKGSPIQQRGNVRTTDFYILISMQWELIGELPLIKIIVQP